VDGGRLSTGTYQFTVVVTARDSAKSSTSASVIIGAGTAPAVVLAVPWNDDERLSLGSAPPTVSAVVQNLSSCADSTSWAWQWSIVETQKNMLLQALTVAAGRPTAPAVFPANILIPGKAYAYAVISAATQGALTGLQFPLSLSEARTRGVQVAVSPAFIADALPVPGVFEVSPLKGTAITTTFYAISGGWSDEHPDRLRYALYGFPVAKGTTMSLNGDALSCNPECNLPSVEWSNVSSANYWPRLSGILLGTSPVASDAVNFDFGLSAGGFHLVLKVTDSAGGSAMVSARGPLVDSVQNGLSQQDVQTALQRAGPSSSALLNTLNAISLTGTNASARTAISQLTLQALQQVSAETNFDRDSLQQLGQVVGRSAGIYDKNSLKSIADLLQNAVRSTSYSATSFSSTADAAASILNGVHSLGVAYIGQSNARALSDARASSSMGINLTQTISELFSKTAEGMAVGESLKVTAETPAQVLRMDVAVWARSSIMAGGSFFNGLVNVPANAVPPSSRRLAAAPCGSVSIGRTEWQGYDILDAASASSLLIGENKSIVLFELEACGTALLPAQAVELVLTVPQGWLPSVAGYNLVCLRFDEDDMAWTTEGVQLARHANVVSYTAACAATHDRGIYTVALQRANTTANSTASTANPTASASSTESPQLPTAFPTAETAKASTVFSVVLGVGVCFTILLCCTAFFGSALVAKRKRDKTRLFINQQDLDLAEMEHDGVGFLPSHNGVTVQRSPTSDTPEEEFNPELVIQNDQEEEGETVEEWSPGMSSVPSIRNGRRRYAV